MTGVRLTTANGDWVATLALYAILTGDSFDYACYPHDVLAYDEVKAIAWELQCGIQEGCIAGYCWKRVEGSSTKT